MNYDDALVIINFINSFSADDRYCIFGGFEKFVPTGNIGFAKLNVFSKLLFLLVN
jgi:hypothetical protein